MCLILPSPISFLAHQTITHLANHCKHSPPLQVPQTKLAWHVYKPNRGRRTRIITHGVGGGGERKIGMAQRGGYYYYNPAEQNQGIHTHV